MWYENRLDENGDILLASNVADMDYDQRWCRDDLSCVWTDDQTTKRYTALFTPEYFESTYEDSPGVTSMAFWEDYGEEFPKENGSFVPDTDLYLGFIARAEKQDATPGGALYVKNVKFTSLATLKEQCTEANLDGQVSDSTYAEASSKTPMKTRLAFATEGVVDAGD